ncbi:MAG TPA: metalloregulator ArsR/SmtB family transcription factor [bacterium]|nr:metalloregulator ArsR/SmtB family transcription factor [bacterium]
MNESELAAVLAALAGETRLRILRLLQARALRCSDAAHCDFTEHCCTVSELADALGVTLPTVSHHLKELRRAGLIRMARRGRFVEVSLQAERLLELSAAFGALARHGATPTQGVS